MSNDIKFRYALDAPNGNLVCVDELDRQDVPKGTVFYALDTNEELRPKLGAIYRKHFALVDKSARIGTYETYLHKLGKKVFFDTYTDCLAQGKPYLIDRNYKTYCTRLQNIFGCSCSPTNHFDHIDLTRYYPYIVEEKRDGSFIPDLLIFNDKGDKIYIEIKVTHASTDSKKGSGIQIVELTIKSEDDIDFIRTGIIHQNHFFYQKINFKTKEYTMDCDDIKNCKALFYCIAVEKGNTNNYKSKILSTIELLDVFERITDKQEIVFFHIQNNERLKYDHLFGYVADSGKCITEYEMYLYALALLYFEKKVEIKSCFTCKHGRNNEPWDSMDGIWAYCYKHKKPKHNYCAKTCAEYKLHYPRLYRIHKQGNPFLLPYIPEDENQDDSQATE